MGRHALEEDRLTTHSALRRERRAAMHHLPRAGVDRDTAPDHARPVLLTLQQNVPELAAAPRYASQNAPFRSDDSELRITTSKRKR